MMKKIFAALVLFGTTVWVGPYFVLLVLLIAWSLVTVMR